MLKELIIDFCVAGLFGGLGLVWGACGGFVFPAVFEEFTNRGRSYGAHRGISDWITYQGANV